MIDLTSRFVRRQQVVFEHVEGKQVLLNLADGRYYALDEVGSRIWSLCDGSHAVAEVVSALCEEYDAPCQVIESDALELLQDLARAELVTEVA